MKNWKLLLAVMVLVLSVAVVAACASYDEPPADNTGTEGETQEDGGESGGQVLRFSNLSVPTIDPQQFNASPSYVAIKGFGEGLVRTRLGEVNPGMAERWEIADDNLKMTFYLREDACWSDGSALTAYDFEYAFQRLADPEDPKSYNWVLYEVKNYPEIESGDLPKEELGAYAVDDHTFVIEFHTPAPYYLSFLDMPPFYPTKRELVEQYGESYGTSADTIIGNGPYKLVEYQIEQRIVYEPNENYWNPDMVKLDQVIYSIMEDEAAFALLETGALDISRIPVAIAENYLNNPAALPDGISVGTYMSGAVDWFSINIASDTNPILGNKDFRLALNYGIDRDEYIAITSGNIYSPQTRFVLPAVSGENGPYVDEYPLDVYSTSAELDKAQEHLQAAMDALGISDPAEITIDLKIADTTPRLIAENAQDQWQRNLGINVNINIVTYRAMLDDRVAGDFDLVYAGWMPDYDDPYTYLSYFVSTNPQNGGGFAYDRYDELVNTANSYPDAGTRLAMYAEAEQILLEEAGIVPLQVREVPYAIRDDLKDFVFFYLGSEYDWFSAYFE